MANLLAHLSFAAPEARSPTSKRDPEATNAFLIGGGIGSLAAAAILIHDAKVPSAHVHILESLKVPGGSMDGAGEPKKGYIARGGRMLNLSYINLYDLLSTIPSLDSPNKTVLQEIEDFNKVHKTCAQARVVTQVDEKPVIMDVTKMGFSNKDRLDLLKMLLQDERSLGTKRINECFEEGFFKTKFWYMWATTFAFQPWHDAKEFRRYLRRFMHEFHRIHTLSGVDRTPYNQFDSIILPITEYLKSKGIDFQYDTKVTNIKFSESGPTTPKEIEMVQGGVASTLHVGDNDIVIATVGSMTSDSSIGDNNTPPSLAYADPNRTLDGAWALWMKIAEGKPNLGNPSNFVRRIPESNWESFTVTLRDPEFFNRMVEWSHNEPGTGALCTFRESNWFMSIVVPHQPHFRGQPDDVQVFWGYGLYTDKVGNYVKKPMSECTGEELFTELLYHLNFPLHPILENSVTLPCMMPYITSQFLTRKHEDRPKVIPDNTKNLALIGQFVEIPDDTVFTVEYSVRGAMMAVYGLMGLDKQPKRIFEPEKSLEGLLKSAEKLLS